MGIRRVSGRKNMNTTQMTEKKVFAFIEEHRMLQPGDRVVAGISGGADSVCLLFVLLEWAKRKPLHLAVVHVNHKIRPEAGQDAEYVKNLCEQNHLPFYYYEEDVHHKAVQEKISEEEAGRMVRYEAFERAAQDFHADKIAVAHNSNDRCETMLFHLFRGSGIKGLMGIRPVRNRIIRPVLCLERKEIEAYLTRKHLNYCRDATNATDDYTRNRIRHHILPYAEQEVSAGCVAHMSQTADMLSETEDYLEQQTQDAMRQCVTAAVEQCEIAEAEVGSTAGTHCDRYVINRERFLSLHRVIAKRILYNIALSLAPGGKDITATHIRDLMTLFTEAGNRSIMLPFGIVGKREYDNVVILKTDRELQIPPEREKPLWLEISDFQQTIPLGEGKELRLSVHSYDGFSPDFAKNKYTKCFDYDKIEKPVVWRTRGKGDYLTIAGKDGTMVHKSLKDYMITGKILREERDKIPLLAQGQHVIWLAGYRISEYYKIDRNTKRILKVQLIGKGCESSETEDENGRTC